MVELFDVKHCFSFNKEFQNRTINFVELCTSYFLFVPGLQIRANDLWMMHLL
jgi:hypothetical protein